MKVVDGELVRQLREEKGLDQKEVADVCGVTQESISQVETGEVKRPRYLLELADVLGVKWESLLVERGKPKTEPGRVADSAENSENGVVDLPQRGEQETQMDVLRRLLKRAIDQLPETEILGLADKYLVGGYYPPDGPEDKTRPFPRGRM